MDEGILSIAGLGRFATDPNCRATDALPGLFALTTKHGRVLRNGGGGGGLGKDGTGRRDERAQRLSAEGRCKGRPGDRLGGGPSGGETADHHYCFVEGG